MSNVIWLVLVGVILIAGWMWYQKSRIDRTLASLTDSGFVVSRQWRSNVLVVADDSDGQLAVVWPTEYRVVPARSLTSIEVTEREMEANRHQYNVVLGFDHPELTRVGLAMHSRGDRARQWAEELQQWRDQYR